MHVAVALSLTDREHEEVPAAASFCCAKFLNERTLGVFGRRLPRLCHYQKIQKQKDQAHLRF